MRVQNKLLIVTLALIMLLIVVTGVLFYRYGENACVERSMTQMKALADTIAFQMESRIQQMDFALLFMLSDPDFLSAVSYYTMPGRADNANRLLISNSESVIKRVMINYALNKNFYRASLITTDGDYFSSRFLEPPMAAGEVMRKLESVGWTQEAQSLRGRTLLIKPYTDPWGNEAANVYGVVRALPLLHREMARASSARACYIEIQNERSEINELLESAAPFNAESAILFSTGEVYYAPGATQSDNDIAAASDINKYGLSVRVWQSREAALEVLEPFKTQVVALCAVALILSAAYLYFASYRLTKPLRAISSSMDATAWDTLNNPPLPSGGDELKAAGEAFSRLCERLKTAVDQQLLSQKRETDARLDSLQAQIDPHFLYNTLNVIAGRAMVIGDDDIVSTCGEIASMLRYSTDTKNRFSTIGLEVAHLTTYLALMKKRYKQKLEYDIDIASAIKDEPMPKIVLQQFAENAVHHGFDGSITTLQLTVRGVVASENWEIEISDNGKGFDECVLARLRSMMETGYPDPCGEGLSIGGMGIVNTYMRLRAFYGDSFHMTIDNARSGAVIRLSAQMRGRT